MRLFIITYPHKLPKQRALLWTLFFSKLRYYLLLTQLKMQYRGHHTAYYQIEIFCTQIGVLYLEPLFFPTDDAIQLSFYVLNILENNRLRCALT